MKNTYLLALGAALTIAVAGPVSATTVVDQSQTVNSGAWSPTNIKNLIFNQSFKAGYNNSVGGGFYLALYASGAATGNVTVSLYSGPVGGAGSTVLASGTAVGTTNNWVDVFWSQTALTVGNTYYLALTSTAPLYVAYAGNNPYTSGTTYANTSDYGSNNYYDLTFRTFADNAAVVLSSSPVPEPASWAMMILGMGAVGFAMRRRNSVKTAVSYA